MDEGTVTGVVTATVDDQASDDGAADEGEAGEAPAGADEEKHDSG